MVSIKKKDILKFKINELVDIDGSPIEGDDSYNTTSQISVSTDNLGSGQPPLTTDKYVKDVRQGNRYHYGPQGVSYPGASQHKINIQSPLDAIANDEPIDQDGLANDITNVDTDAEINTNIGAEPEASEISIDTQGEISPIDQLNQLLPTLMDLIQKINGGQMSESVIDEIAKNKMMSMVEDMISDKTKSSHDVISKTHSKDVSTKISHELISKIENDKPLTKKEKDIILKYLKRK